MRPRPERHEFPFLAPEPADGFEQPLGAAVH